MPAAPPMPAVCPSCHRPTGLPERPCWRQPCPHCGHRTATARPDLWLLIFMGLCWLLAVASYWLISAWLPPDRQALPLSGLMFFMGAAGIARAVAAYLRTRRRIMLVGVGTGLFFSAMAVWQLAKGMGW